MRDMQNIEYGLEEILNTYTALKAIKGKKILISQLLKLIEREQNISYDNGYQLKSQKRQTEV